MAVQTMQAKMDDGVNLTVNVGYPTDLATGQRASGTFPVLLSQSPYAAVGGASPDSYFVTRGYIFAMAEVRATGTSGGNFGFFSPRDARDGADLVNWAANSLAGSNGVVGLQGCSYLGESQIFTAALLGPRSPVKAMVPACATNSYSDPYFAGGLPAEVAGFKSTGSPSILGANATAFLNDIYNNMIAGGNDAYNRQFWQVRTLTNLLPQVASTNIPALFWTGWQAADLQGGLALYSGLQNAYFHRPVLGPMQPRQPTTGRYQIIVEPGTHGQGLDKEFQLEWFDNWLKGQDTDITNTSTPMHLFEPGASRWINTNEYPMVSRYTPFYLGSGGSLSSQATRGSGGSDTLLWADPTTPGAMLTYTTPPFPNGATLAGPITATVYASSNNSNLELIADLYDVAGGTATQVTSGALLGSMRAVNPALSWYDQNGVLIRPDHPFSGDKYVPAGKVRAYDISLWPQLLAIQPGHSLRLVLSTQEEAADCLPVLVLAIPRPACGALTAPQQQTLPDGVYTVYYGPSRSTIELPLLPPGAFPTATSAVTPTSGTQTEPLYWGPPQEHGRHRR
jgi:predicted acyl esterase